MATDQQPFQAGDRVRIIQGWSEGAEHTVEHCSADEHYPLLGRWWVLLSNGIVYDSERLEKLEKGK